VAKVACLVALAAMEVWVEREEVTEGVVALAVEMEGVVTDSRT